MAELPGACELAGAGVLGRMASTNRGLGFRIDEAVGGPVVTVRSADTGEVVRQIPNEVVVRVAHNIDKIKGLLLNAKA